MTPTNQNFESSKNFSTLTSIYVLSGIIIYNFIYSPLQYKSNNQFILILCSVHYNITLTAKCQFNDQIACKMNKNNNLIILRKRHQTRKHIYGYIYY